MTLNGVIVLILGYFTEFDSLGPEADYVTMVEDRPVMCAEILFRYRPNLTYAAVARSLCDAQLLVLLALRLVHIFRLEVWQRTDFRFRRIQLTFYRAACNADRRSLSMTKLFVCLFVCPSAKRVDCDKTEERFVQIFTPYDRTFTKFSEKNGWWGATPST